ncbi:hypothetical protein IWW56_002960 [Coemansia sp. RSA 2131]|nr:hypothetical protein IWW56_002960 [Coemansia sp. RSA 2131]
MFNSLFKMLRRELLPDLFLDPSFNPLPLENSEFQADTPAAKNTQMRFSHPLLPFLQFSRGIDDSANQWTYERQSAPGVPVAAADVSWYGGARGGIICEDMGTGKTCECLALTLLTKRQMAQPPIEGELLPCVGTVCSPLITDLCCTPTDQHLELQNSSGQCTHVHSLRFLAARAALSSCAESLRVMHDDGMISDDTWKCLEPYPPFYWANPITDGRPKRGITSHNIEQMAFKVYMSSSTIIVVPDNLVDQWVREKYKHIKDDRGLEMLKIDNSTEVIPEPLALIKYDLVLISVSRLSKEYIPIDSKIGELRHACRCYLLGHEQCFCQQRHEGATCRSPLLRVHWKRLIVDEGHIMSSRNTARALMAAYLIAERRWICTGTPTHNLVHATSATSVNEQTLLGDEADHGFDKVPAKHRCRMDLRENASDFLQLGILISKFLRMDPFAHSTSAWTSVMVQPYKRGDPSARMRLQALLQSVMVRNRPETVADEVHLPPLHERTVTLRPTRLQALTYNAVVAFFHINAILTERTGRDYFFHPENKKHLRQIVANLFLACLWFSIRPKHVHDGIENGQRALYLWKQGQKPYSLDDVELLQESVAALQRVSNDSEWKYAVQADSTGYCVSGIPTKLAIGLFPYQPSDSSTKESNLVSEPTVYLASAIQLQDVISAAKSMLVTTDDMLPPLAANIDPREFEMLQHAKVLGCTSNKVAYIIDCVRRYSQDEKCIVFVSSQNDAVLVDDALYLARIPHLLYANAVMSQSQRRHNITTFSTSIMYNVIVMDVNLAAYGIDLSTASRVWFMSPIWQAARERQAIKRAHRLGQQRPVYIETLLTEGSIEEALWARRQEISSEDSQLASKDIEEDGKMRNMLSNARFIDNDCSGALEEGIRILPANIRYPSLLRQKYQMWSPSSPGEMSSKVPFYKTKRLILRLPTAETIQSTPAQ